eukprot:TRINITY_DN5270_c1_g1_i30.p4 TRINITY_DN5270_c1_g1~~TRINITY_DN5270_c1_g1_i30.p4  ORF type:complete len:105 (-),score=0.28 TRINITY_DN5270_c1_g1_i30:185-499(-)
MIAFIPQVVMFLIIGTQLLRAYECIDGFVLVLWDDAFYSLEATAQPGVIVPPTIIIIVVTQEPAKQTTLLGYDQIDYFTTSLQCAIVINRCRQQYIAQIRTKQN